MRAGRRVDNGADGCDDARVEWWCRGRQLVDVRECVELGRGVCWGGGLSFAPQRSRWRSATFHWQWRVDYGRLSVRALYERRGHDVTVYGAGAGDARLVTHVRCTTNDVPREIGLPDGGAVTSVTTVAGTTAYALDLAGRRTRIDSPCGTLSVGHCPWNGLVSAVTNANGIVAAYDYDIMNRVTNITWRTASGARLGGFAYRYDALGRIVARWTYDAWGNILSEEVAAPALAAFRYRFQGREFSAVTGVTNFRARWYDPGTGRWLSKDPIRLLGGINLYAFCSANPVCNRDPFGETSQNCPENDFIPPVWTDIYEGTLHDEYGDVLEYSDTLGLIGLGSTIWNGVSSLYGSIINGLADGQISSAKLAGALTDGNILSKRKAAQAGAQIAARTQVLETVFTKASAVGTGVTIVATGFSLGARAYAAGVATIQILLR